MPRWSTCTGLGPDAHGPPHRAPMRWRTLARVLIRHRNRPLLLTHYAIRHIMKDAADTVGTDPDDLSFIRSYRGIRRQVTNQAGFLLKDALLHLSRPLTERPNPPRRHRTSLLSSSRARASPVGQR
jgi:hypothetical protein